MAPEIFVPFASAGRSQMATAIRSTVIVSSMQALRAHGLFDAYVAKIHPAHREELLALIAGKWIGVDLAIEHYRAAERLALDDATIDRIGAAVADRVKKAGFSLVLKASREAGVTPWTGLAGIHRMRELNWQGSDACVTKLGPKEARIEHVGVPLASVPYYVKSFGGFLRGLTRLLSPTVYTRVEPQRCSATALSYRMSWV